MVRVISIGRQSSVILISLCGSYGCLLGQTLYGLLQISSREMLVLVNQQVRPYCLSASHAKITVVTTIAADLVFKIVR